MDKRELLQREGITLVVVPCWWDGSLDSLVETILYFRPDLEFSNNKPNTPTSPIHLNPPPHFFNYSHVPGVGELMLASFSSIDPKFNSPFSENSWWLGEKYDGIRFCWSPVQKRITGREIELKEEVYPLLPRRFVDGEFWFGRAGFAHTYALVKNSATLVNWQYLRMIMFDVASPKVQQHAFELRYTLLLKLISFDNQLCSVAFRVLCKNFSFLNFFVSQILEDEGEGGILRRVGSKYEHGRSSNLIKLKASNSDKEGVVRMIHEDGTVRLQLPDMSHVDVPVTAGDIKVTVGDVVTFTYDRYARKDVPMNPKLLRIRFDLSWTDVVLSFHKDLQSLPERKKVGFSMKPKGHWTEQTMKEFFVNFAKQRGLDPLLPETWYSIPSDLIYQSGGNAILRKYGGYYRALQQLFPEINFEHSSFARPIWSSISNRRVSFENYARENKFDPLVAANWYDQPYQKIMESIKEAKSILAYHNYRISKALIDLFPNIGLDESKFQTRSSWQEVDNRRKFFLSYAEKMKFDPRVADNWYLHVDKVLEVKGTRSITTYHNNSVSQALLDLFPDIGLTKSKFRPKSWWHDFAKRHKFFEEYAKAKAFDPSDPENWYSQTMDQILSFKGASRVMYYYHNKLSVALRDVFPDIGLEKERFYYKPPWAESAKRKKFFEDFALQNGFDPLEPENWYSPQIMKKFTNLENASKVVFYHNRSVVQALMDLFPNIGLDRVKLRAKSPWNYQANRRKFFEEYASEHNFDPLIADNWYQQQQQKIILKKGGSEVLYHHKSKLHKALGDCFPDVQFKVSKFKHTT